VAKGFSSNRSEQPIQHPVKISSIKTKIQIAVVLFIAITFSMGGIFIYLNIKKVSQVHTERDLKSIAILVGREIETADGNVVYDWYDDIQQDPISREKDYIQSWALHGEMNQRSPALKDFNLPKFHGKPGEFVYRNTTVPHHGKKHRARAVGVLVTPTITEQSPEQRAKIKQTIEPHILVIAQDTERYDQFLDRFKWGIGLTIIIITIISILIIHFILRAALLPIQELSTEIAKKDEEQLGSGFQIKPHFPLELRDLVNQYNELLKRMEQSLSREKRFSSFVAHELRTPLTGISTTLELALNRPRETDYYQNSIQDTLKITHSMQCLINRLLTLSRLQNNQSPTENRPVDIQQLLKSIWEDHSHKADTKNIHVSWTPSKTHTHVTTDLHLASILVSNLLENAVAYAPPHTTIQIEIIEKNKGNGIQQPEAIYLMISNETRELKPEDLTRLSEPFFRKDKARTMEDNHFGIGLSICREISRVLDLNLTPSLETINNNTWITFRLAFKRTKQITTNSTPTHSS